MTRAAAVGRRGHVDARTPTIGELVRDFCASLPATFIGSVEGQRAIAEFAGLIVEVGARRRERLATFGGAAKRAVSR